MTTETAPTTQTTEQDTGNTEAAAALGLAAADLARILEQTAPHRGDHEYWPRLAVTRLDADAHHLHAITTDRFTIAVARAATTTLTEGRPWAASVNADDATMLAAWARSRGYDEPVRLLMDGQSLEASTLTLTSRLKVPASTGDYVVQWRPFLRRHLEQPPAPLDLTGLDTRYLRRWEQAGNRLAFAQAGPAQPLIVSGPDFIGMQMPVRHRDATTREGLATDWTTPGDRTAPDTAPALPLPDPDQTVARMTGDLLKRVLLSTQDLTHAPLGDHQAMAVHASAAAYAWIGHRVLQALAQTDPRQADRLVVDLRQELDAGDYSERAYDEAGQAGHDPQAWIDAYHARRDSTEQPAGEHTERTK
ncbi:hypothetical protein [Kitasatospora sp. MY 5-36]|uniref:hypothetical protein n=1 Tax=Kitasatospora sp. MY 5-36 TaxID=1678027 RepID=UPI000670B61E|nr:hypothetical protein [Kitasatospora sp. MY 5-36]